MCPHEWAKHRCLRAVPSLDPASTVWTSPPLVVALAKFIKATVMGYSEGMQPLGTDSPYITPQASPRQAAPPRQDPSPYHSHALVGALAEAWGASM